MLVIASEGGHFPNSLLMASAFWALAMGFFAFGYSDDSESCLADNGEDLVKQVPNSDGEMDGGALGVDVGERFHTFFLVGFYLCAFQLVVGMATHVISGYDITRALYNLYHYSQLFFMIDWIYGLYVRFTPSGQSCSGTWDSQFKDGTLYQSGLFIFVAGCIITAVFAMTLLNSVVRKIKGHDTI